MQNSFSAVNRTASTKRRRRNRRGQTLVEYALIIGLIALVAISALIILGTQIRTLFTTISSQMAQSTGSH
jgi:pilus assembly protein Flp/PilA